ncbi:MAG: hypothetical protein GF313_06365 [Caldithrix sp.]|nr:hypothetical protein [Caldithrix sp.]
MRFNFLIALLTGMLLTNGMRAENSRHFLSNLQATKNSPLYTTYAAAMDRSEFTLDQGFHLKFYEDKRGVELQTDTAGDWCLGFKREADFAYELNDLFKEPIITTSYPDLVRYHYYPFEDMRVDVFFMVYSSRIAIQDVTLTNEGEQPSDFKIYSFLRNDYRVFNNVQRAESNDWITFTHEELPDGWVLSHDIPYVNPVYDIFMMTEPADRLTSYRSFQWGDVSVPHQVDLDKKRQYVVWGKMAHQSGERCRHRNPKPQLMVVPAENNRRLLTETAPRWGSTDQNITGYGFYGIELGNFQNLKENESYEIYIRCRETGTVAQLAETLNDLNKQGNRRDLTFTETNLPQTPDRFRKDVWGSGTEIRLYWDHVDGAGYNVYRRDYRQQGYYELVAGKISNNFYTDKNLSGDEIYGYVVTAVDSSTGRMSMPTDELTNIFGSDFLTDMKYPDQRKTYVRDLARVVSMQKNVSLAPGEQKELRVMRGVARNEDKRRLVMEKMELLRDEPLKPFIEDNEKRFANIPVLPIDDQDLQMLYYSAYSMMRQVFLPPENKASYNYYVFSREPTWGWGHGGQVFHESITMLAYALMDPVSAMNSQRVYSERQYDNGYINYRTGSYLDEIIEHNGELTSSAPWYAWQNYEVYKIAGDKDFLEEMYASSKKFYNFYVPNRDKDGDGLCEWGGHAVLESVRDASVAVWDEVGWPTNFEAMDLNSMLVNEANALASMAEELGLPEEAAQLRKDARTRAQLINETFWDAQDGFYYHVDKKDNDFTFEKTADLKRQEIIGFLPMWAGIASEAQAEILVTHLTDPQKFWRPFGVPSLSAADSYYNPKGYWNGPVWVEWNYLIMDGLIQYGYREEARELVMRVAKNMVKQLKKDHNLWEFYSPDDQWAGYHKTYIWAGIINRMLLDVADF